MVRSVTASIAIVAALLAHTASGRDIELLDFSSPNCGPCQQMAPTIKALIDAGYPITRIDVTRDPQMAARYQVPRVPTLIMLVDGQVFDRTEGGTTGPRIEGMFQRAQGELERRKQDLVRLQSPDRRPAVQPVAQSREVQPPSSVWPAASRGNEPSPAGADARLGDSRTETSRNATFSSQTSAAEANGPLDQRFAKFINSSVRLRVDDENGRSFGTGTIIDARQGEALVITCGHLFRETKGKGPLTVEMFEATPGGVRSAGQVPGQVISYDLTRDVALVAIRPGRAVTPAPVALPRTSIQRGDRVVSIGCSNGQDPTAMAARITTLDRYQGGPNIEATGAPVEGRSGGGLFNQDGQLIGICFAADKEGNEGLYAALKAIHDELNSRGLSDVYLPGELLAANGRAPVGVKPAAASGPVVRGQDPGTESMTRPNREPVSQADIMPLNPISLAVQPTPFPPSAGLSPAEQAALEEISRRAATSEVVCIIRPKQPGGQSEVITLDNVSPEFVRALASRSQIAAPLTR